MKIFIQNNKFNPVVKVIKEERISPDCWNVIIHSFALKDQKVLYTLNTYKEISELYKDILDRPERYEFYGSYCETSRFDLKCLQAKCMGVRVLLSIVHQENVSHNEIISTYASSKYLSEDGFHILVRGHGWTFQTIEEEPLNDKLAAEHTKKVEVKIDLKLEKVASPYIKLVDRILYDEEKRIVIVFFVDGTKIVKKCHAEDKFDVYTGVSLAITKYLFGNNTTNFVKFVNRKKKKLTNKKEVNKQQPKAD